QLRDALSSRRDDWNGRFASPDHLDSIKAEAELLQIELAEDSVWCPSLYREKWWLDTLRWVIKFVSEVSDAVFAKLDERCKRALRLGCWVDRGILPRDAYRLMCSKWARTAPNQTAQGVNPWA